MKLISSFFTLFLLVHSANAQIIVSTQMDLDNAINAVRPGDTIILKNGIWQDAQILLDAEADEFNPIVIQAETAGQVFFEGNPKIRLGGAYIFLEGIIFSNSSQLLSDDNRIDPIIEFKNNSNCNHCKITNLKIEGFNGDPDQELDIFHWIAVYGQFNEISHCSFTGKNGLGKIISVIVDPEEPNFAEIHHNYFANRIPVNGIINFTNGQEAITIGASSTSLSNSNSKVYNNLFLNWAGEIEIVSNKSGGNQYYNNTFRNHSGTLTLRHGNNCEVFNNYFFGENNLLSGGIRVMGEGHKVYNNYLEKLSSQKPDGTNSRATGGINISNGKPNSALNEYYQVKNTIIINNTFVDCDYGIQVGSQVKSDLSLPPENLIVSNNIFLNSSKKTIREVSTPIGNSLYEGNISQNGSWDISASQGNQIVNSDLLQAGGQFYRLPSSSPAINGGRGLYGFLNKDILYGNRETTYDAGCEEYGSNGQENFPYSLIDVGTKLGFQPSGGGTVVNYNPSSQIIPNPERGLQKYSITASNYSTIPGANNLPVSMLQNWKNGSDHVTVVFRYFLLDDFLTSDINATYLENIQRDFDNIRVAGLKVIVRFSYSDDYTEEDEDNEVTQQPSKAQILQHIDQIGPLLSENADIIFSLQAGFIGTWGEWYYTHSSEFGHQDDISSSQWANRKEILDAMLAITPEAIPLQVRYVGIKSRLYGTSPLNAQTAYSNTPNARIGFYNDAFLNDWGDQGTYTVNSQCQNPVGTSDYDFLSNETQYLPMTGETNGLNPCGGVDRTSANNATNELELTNWTTLNRDYHPQFWNEIITSGHYDEILKNLGYRFVLNSTTITENGLDFDLDISLQNIGYARVFKERDVYLVMRNTQTNNISTYLINTDIRTWEHSISLSQKFNPGITGTYKIYLWMPDKSASLASNPSYSIQFGNEDLWDPVTGYNDLLQTVSLSCNTTFGTDMQTACNTFTWIDGNTYTESTNSAIVTLTGSNGCDSIVTLDLTIENSTFSTDTHTACNTFTWIDGNTYTESNNSAIVTLTGSNGCDSIVTLDLTIENSTFSTDTHTACNAFTWIDGNTYTENNNSAMVTLTSSNGCDSIVTLDLTLENSTFSTDTHTACNVFTWIDGNTYTENNNSAMVTLTGSNGCDSIVTLDLTINSVADITTTTNNSTITANNTNAMYQWLDCTEDFKPIPGATNISFTATTDGEYAVELIENNCIDTSMCVPITVVSNKTVTSHNAFRLYPNPTSESVFIQNFGNFQGHVYLFDANGKEITKTKLDNTLFHVRLDDMPAGIYWLKIITKNQSIVEKLIKQ